MKDIPHIVSQIAGTRGVFYQIVPNEFAEIIVNSL